MIELIITDKAKVRETQQAPFLGRRPPQPSANVFATVEIRLLSANGKWLGLRSGMAPSLGAVGIQNQS
jgi:hypothetical protein